MDSINFRSLTLDGVQKMEKLNGGRMKKYLSILVLVVSLFVAVAQAWTGDGMPFKYISSCEIDLNKDELSDFVLLAEFISGRRLIVFLANKKGEFDSYTLSKDKSGMHLACHFGTDLKETLTGSGKGRTFKTNGTYISLTKPEASSVAFFWTKEKFEEVWTAD